MGSEIPADRFRVRMKRDVLYTNHGTRLLEINREYEAKRLKSGRIVVHDDRLYSLDYGFIKAISVSPNDVEIIK